MPRLVYERSRQGSLPTQRLDRQLMRFNPAISARRSKDPEAVSSLAVRCQPLCELCDGTLPSLSASRITAYRHLLQGIDTYDET